MLILIDKINKKESIRLLIALLSIVIFGIVSGIALTQQRLQIVDSNLLKLYPASFYLSYIITRIFTVTLYWFINTLIVGLLFRLNYLTTLTYLGRFYILLSLTYLFGYINSFYIFPLILIVINGFAIWQIRRDFNIFKMPFIYYKTELLAIALIVIVYLLIFSPLIDPLVSLFDIQSPWFQYLYTYERVIQFHIPSTISLQEVAWSPTYACGSMPFLNPGGSFSTELLTVLFFKIFNISFADLASILYVIKANIFIIFALCGIGYYFLFRVGFNFPFSTSFLIGLVSVINVGIIQRHTEIVMGYSICYYPFVLLAIKCALDRKKLWLYTVAGLTTTGVFMLLRTEAEVLLSLTYFIIAWSIWHIIVTCKNRSDVFFRIKGIIVYCFTCVILNYQILTSIIDYISKGNILTSSRIFFPLNPTQKGAMEVVKDLLAIFGFAGTGHITSPVTPQGAVFGGLFLSFFVVFGIYVYFKGLVKTNDDNTAFISYSFIALVLVAIIGYTYSVLSYAAYTVKIEGFPFHLPLRALGLYHPISMVLAAFGHFAFSSILNESNDKKYLHIVKFAFIYFSIVAIYYTLQNTYQFSTGLLALQIAVSLIVILSCVYVLKKHILRQIFLIPVVLFIACISLPDSTIINLDGYHKTVFKGSNLPKKMLSNNIIDRIIHPEYFVSKIAPIPLNTILAMANRDINNIQTRFFIYNLLKDYKHWLIKLKEFATKKDSWSSQNNLSEEIDKVEDILKLINHDYNQIDRIVIEKIKTLSDVYNNIYRINEVNTGGWQLSEMLFSLIPDIASYNRTGFYPSNILLGSGLRYLPINEEIIGSVPSVSRWYNIMDYYDNNISFLQTTTDYIYDNFAFPSKEAYLSNILNIKYAMISRDSLTAYPYLKSWQELISVNTLTGVDFLLLKNNDALPRASIFSNFKVVKPIVYNKYNVNEPARIDYGLKMLSSIDHQNELLIESDKTLQELSNKFKLESGRRNDDNLKILSIISNFAVFSVDNKDVGGLLFYSDMYHDSWRGFIDTKETEIYRTNLTFKSIYVPAGKHIVWFEFRSKTLFWIKLMAIFTANTILLGLIIFNSSDK